MLWVRRQPRILLLGKEPVVLLLFLAWRPNKRRHPYLEILSSVICGDGEACMFTLYHLQNGRECPSCVADEIVYEQVSVT